MIRAAFLGTPGEAVPILEAVTKVAEVTLVITQPDKPRKRSGRDLPSAVKVAATEAGLPVAQPRRKAELAALVEGCDVAVVAAYGRIVPPDALVVPRAGFVNVHFSVLPRWRGASPVVRAILAGDERTGITLMQMDPGLDTGPVLSAEATPIGADETAGELTERLSLLGAQTIRQQLAAIVAGEVARVPQDEAAATAAAKVDVDEAFLMPSHHRSVAIHRAVRAFNPRPGAWSVVDGQRFKVWRTAVTDITDAVSGLVERRGRQVVLGCADGAVELQVVQPQGRSAMSADAWMNGRRNEPARFTAPG